jgi:spore germination cell wall hydrolase CwlJ-like protein
MDCVADTIYYEARGEGEVGMRAVAHVIYNRAKEQGKNPCIIVAQPKQFARGPSKPRDKQWQIAKRISMNPGADITKGATYFHNLSVRPYWIRSLQVTFTWGGHIFYRK